MSSPSKNKRKEDTTLPSTSPNTSKPTAEFTPLIAHGKMDTSGPSGLSQLLSSEEAHNPAVNPTPRTDAPSNTDRSSLDSGPPESLLIVADPPGPTPPNALCRLSVVEGKVKELERRVSHLESCCCLMM
ncbi:hypothetical protein HYALB_00000486 [Hymenoscyphus albidus]|uniref:Uncharacterized protein n=1 Tax=Hymenoscyphus albidus TaxID=595503 RepID=A0A9N9LNV4_9HELO|nr:hypothetical protein HYALB_00000486 [Hymenoscyphus albidus]